jgi:hypothetical protein
MLPAWTAVALLLLHHASRYPCTLASCRNSTSSCCTCSAVTVSWHLHHALVALLLLLLPHLLCRLLGSGMHRSNMWHKLPPHHLPQHQLLVLLLLLFISAAAATWCCCCCCCQASP